MSKIKAIQGIAKFFGYGAKAAKVNKTKKVIKLAKKPPVKAPVVKKTVKAPVVKKPPVKAPPVVKKPPVKAPVVKKPPVKAPVVKKPVVKKPVVKKPIVKKPIVKKPIVKKPKKPVVKKTTSKKPPVKKSPIKDNSYSGTNLDTRAGKVAEYAGKKADAIGKGVAGVIKAPAKGARYLYRNPKKAAVTLGVAGVASLIYNQNKQINKLIKSIEVNNKKTKPKTVLDNDLYKSDTLGKAAYDKKKALKPTTNSSADSIKLKKLQANLDSLILLSGKKNR
jgi:hypothetical protein